MKRQMFHLLHPGLAVMLYSKLVECLIAQGKPGEAVPKLKQDWKDAIIANWKLWPFFQFVNFRFVPPEQRVMTYILFAGYTCFCTAQGHHTAFSASPRNACFTA
jgi:Mpv17 / PMP22 family